MFRDMTLSDATRLELEVSGADAAFHMDEETFRAFYDRTKRGLWVYLVRVTGDRQLADDLLQEAFYRFLRAAAVHESETHRRNSLFRIATNLARDARRRRLLRPFHDPQHTEERDVADLRDAAGQTEQRADLTRAMARLKPRERALVWLAYANGSSHREIADTLGVQTSSVKPLLFRARRKLAALLGKGRETEGLPS